MIWEALTAMGTLVTSLVIFATVILGARQLRATNDQLAQLRQATQLDGTMRIFEMLRSPAVRDAHQFVFAELASRLDDEGYRREAEKVGGVDPVTHPERVVMQIYEEIGTYVKHSLLHADVIYDFNAPVIVGCWRRLAPLIAIQRKTFGDESLWCNFEFLARGAKAWEDVNWPESPDGDPTDDASAPRTEIGHGTG